MLPDSEAGICSSLGRLSLYTGTPSHSPYPPLPSSSPQCGDVRTAQQYFQTVDSLSKSDSSKLPLVHNNR